MTSKLSKRPLTNAIESIDFSRELPVQRKSRAAALPLGALMLAASVSSWAQTASSEQTLPEIKVQQEQEVSSKESIRTTKTRIGKGVQEIRDIPQSMSVITEKLLDDANLTTLKDALQYTSGITFAATENGTDQDIRVRGFPVARTGDLFIDGMRDPSQYDRDTFNYDSIEILRGSASMVFGRGSTGGAINQVTKKPFLNNQNEVTLSGGTGSNFRTTGDFNIMTGDESALRINIMGQDAKNDGANIQKYGVAPSYSWGIGTRDEFNVSAYYLDVDNVPIAGLAYMGGQVYNTEPGKFYGANSDYLKGSAKYIAGSHLHTFGDGSTLRTQLRTGEFERAYWGSSVKLQSGIDAANFDNTKINIAGLSPRKNVTQGTFLQSDYSKEFEYAGMKHAVITGVDGAYETSDIYSAYGTSFAGTTAWTGTKGTSTLGAGNSGLDLAQFDPNFRKGTDYQFKSFGIYGQDLIEFAPHWKFLAGVRFDAFSGDFNTYTYAGQTTNVTGKTTTSLSDNMFSYRTGLIYQPTDTASFHLAYGTSFNTSADTYQYVTPMNANTPPEKSRNIELGAKLDWLDGALSTRAAIFRTEKYNERTSDADFAGTAYLLTGKRHTQGLELDIVGKITPKLEAYLSYTYIQEAKIDEAGSNITVKGAEFGLTPKHSIAAWLGYQATADLRVAAGATAKSENYALNGTTGQAQKTARAPGYATFDMMADYTINKTWAAKLNVSNIFNRAYGDQLYPGFVVLGTARAAQLQLIAKF